MRLRQSLALAALLLPALLVPVIRQIEKRPLPAPDPFAAIEIRLRHDVADRAALRALVAFAAQDRVTAAPDDTNLSVSNAMRATRLLGDVLTTASASERAAVERELVAVVTPLDHLTACEYLPLMHEAVGGRAKLDLAELFSLHGYSLFAEQLMESVRAENVPNAMPPRPGLLPIAHSQPPATQQFTSYEVRGWRSPPHPCILLPANDRPANLAPFRLTLDDAGERLALTFRGADKPHFEASFPRSTIRQVLASTSLGGRARLLYQFVGPLVVVSLGDRVLAFSPVTQEMLWQRALFDGPQPDVANATGMDDGSIVVRYRDDTSQLLGRPLIATPTCLLLPLPDRLIAVSPATGRTLWSRRGVASGAFAFSDGRNVYVVERNAAGKAVATSAYRLLDGQTVRVADFAALYDRSVGERAGRLLVPDAGAEAFTLRLASPANGEVSRRFAKGSLLVDSLNPNWTGVAEPNGHVHLLDAATGKTLWTTATADGLPASGIKAIRLWADADYVYVAKERFLTQEEKAAETKCKPLFRDGYGLPSIPVNGKLSAHERATGNMRWWDDYEDHALLVGEDAERLPFLVLAVSQRRVDRRGLHPPWWTDDVRAIRKRNGKTEYFPERASGWAGGGIVAIEADPEHRWVWLLGERMRVDLNAR